MKAGDFSEEIRCEINPNFNDDEEIVIRKSDFISKRTLGINADKAAVDLNKEFIKLMKNPNQKLIISLS